MINYDQFVKCEATFPKHFSNFVKKPYGYLFYNLNNKESHDSNHAIINDLSCDLDSVFQEIIYFYKSKGITPRIYSGFINGEVDLLKPYFTKFGFQFQEQDTTKFFYLNNKSTINPNPHLVIKRITQLSQQMIDLIRRENEGDYTINVLKEHLLHPDFHFLVGLINNEAVCVASLNEMDQLSRIDDVITDLDHRGKGYGSTLIHRMISYHHQISNQPLYLYAEDEIAIRIYQKAGFIPFETQPFIWSAYQE